MEKIFLFIIIMIISSILSKKKKKAKQEEFLNQTGTTYFDENGNLVTGSSSVPKPKPVSKPVTDLKDVFSAFTPSNSRNDEQADRLKRYEKKLKEKKKDEEEARSDPYGNISQSQDKLEPSQDDMSNSYDKISTFNDNFSTAANVSNSAVELKKKMVKDQIVPGQTNFEKIGKPIKLKEVDHYKQNKVKKVTPFTNLINSRAKLKQAIVMSEIINRKY